MSSVSRSRDDAIEISLFIFPRCFAGCIGLAAPDIALIKKRLTLKIAQLYDVVVDDEYMPDSGARKIRRGRRAERALTDYGNVCAAELFLPRVVDIWQTDLPVISIVLIHFSSPLFVHSKQGLIILRCVGVAKRAGVVDGDLNHRFSARGHCFSETAVAAIR